MGEVKIVNIERNSKMVRLAKTTICTVPRLFVVILIDKQKYYDLFCTKSSHKCYKNYFNH